MAEIVRQAIRRYAKWLLGLAVLFGACGSMSKETHAAAHAHAVEFSKHVGGCSVSGVGL